MTDKASYIRGRILDRNIGSCKDITPDQMEIISILSMEHDVYEQMKRGGRASNTATKPLLTIELQNEASVPKVFYKGEEVKFKKGISFDWDTSDAYSPGGLSYAIEHYEQGGQATCNRIERRVRDHAT